MAKYFSLFLDGHDSIRFSFIFFFHLLSPHIHNTCNCERADENPLAGPVFSLHYISFELSTNRDMYSTRNTCDDLLRQYHLLTVQILCFCQESENFAGASVRSTSSRLSSNFLIPILSPNYFIITSILTPQLTLGLTKATSSKHFKHFIFCIYKYSRLLYFMKVLPVYQKVDLFFLQCHTVICIKKSQSPESAMPTKTIHPGSPGRISAAPLKEDGQEHPLRIRHGRVINPPAQEIRPPKGHSQASPFPSVLPSYCSSSGRSMLSG